MCTTPRQRDGGPRGGRGKKKPLPSAEGEGFAGQSRTHRGEANTLAGQAFGVSRPSVDRAERRLGEMLAAMEKQGPGEYKRSHDVTVCPSLADLGITKMQSSRWQAIARAPSCEEVQPAEAKKRQAQAAGRPRGAKQVSVRANLPEQNVGQSREQAGAAVNVSGKSVDRARKV